ncbi:extracellular solute-binding protein [candidate division KSB1 bacterium]|nr:extracellular solute-binding protein [candidate division KSB1 bacterium]
MQIKRFYSTIILLSIFSIFTKCSSTSDTGETEITLNLPANASLLQSLREKIPQFTQKSGIKIKIIPFSGQEKLYAMMAAGNPPDIFYTNTVVRDRLAAEGRLFNIWQVARGDSFVDRIKPVFIERGTAIDGGWYQFCDWTFTYGVYFNKALFDKQAIPYPDSVWTWETMQSAAAQLTQDFNQDGKIDQYGIFIARHFASAIELMNGAEYEPNALFFSLSPQAIEAQQAYLDLMFKDKVMPELNFVEAQGMQSIQMMNTGRVAMIVEAVPNLDLVKSLTVDWALAPLPRMRNYPPRYFRSASGGLSISKTCKNPTAAWQVMKWLVTESEYNSPNPILNDVDFVTSYENTNPELKNKNFRQVWELSKRYDGGDNRDFVRYSSWSSAVILEQINPKLDLIYAGKKPLSYLIESVDLINEKVVIELNSLLKNDNLMPVFREKIREELVKVIK